MSGMPLSVSDGIQGGVGASGRAHELLMGLLVDIVAQEKFALLHRNPSVLI